MTTTRVEALGVAFRVSVADPALSARLRHVLSPLIPSGDDRQGVEEVIRVGGTGPWRIRSRGFKSEAQSLAEAVSGGLAAVNLTAVALSPHLCVHAAVVERDGTLVAIPAASGTGKTTLAGALLRRGWRYVSDESLALRWDDGSLLAYPRSLAVSHWTRESLGMAERDAVPGFQESVYLPESVGAGVHHPGPSERITHVLVPVRRDGGPALRPLHRAQALAELLRRGFSVHRDPRAALDLLADLVRGAETWTVLLGDPLQTAELVEHQLAEHHP